MLQAEARAQLGACLGARGDLPASTAVRWRGRTLPASRDLAAFLAVPAATDFQARHDWPRLRPRLRLRLRLRLRCHQTAVETLPAVTTRNGLTPIAGDDRFAQMVSIPVRTNKAEALRTHLFDRHRIEVPVTQRGAQTFVRVSAQALNTQAELKTLISALALAGV